MKKMTKEKKNKLTSINDDYLTVYHVKKGKQEEQEKGYYVKSTNLAVNKQ